MGQLGLEVADVFRRYGEAFGASMSRAQQHVNASCAEPPRLVITSSSAITCDRQRAACNSFRDRHCPKCQSLWQASAAPPD
jgi:hypothetical protein